jgi:predicted membrane channel-forming protein YqfA (hemolysin III family)
VGILLIAGQFFINGLNRKNDYLRINHGLWHLFAGVAHYYGMNCTTWKIK